MITEDYVSFETAKLLKEKGFNEQCYAYYNIFYDNDGKDLKLWRKYPHRAQPNTDYLNVPTLQTAMKWLRKAHDIYIMIDKDFATENGWHYVVVRKQDWADNIDNGLTQQESNNYTYEFACEAAIKYCLENLI